MSDEAPVKSSRTWLYVVGILMSLPLLYVLSTGPMVVLVARKIIPEPAMEAVYAPLIWFTAKTDTDELIEAYVGSWLKLTSTPIP